MKTQERVFSDLIVYFPIYSELSPPPDMLGLGGIRELTRKEKEESTILAWSLAAKNSVEFPFNPLDQQPLFTMTIGSKDTSSWSEIASNEDFHKAVVEAVESLTLDFGSCYAEAMIITNKMINKGELDSSIDYVCAFHIVLICEEGKPKNKAISMESRIAVFATQGKVFPPNKEGKDENSE